jgi:hypothetical protein
MNTNIQHLHFLTKDDDFLLLASESQVAIKSPFGGAQSCYLGNDEWSVDMSSFGRDAKVVSVIPCGDSGFFAVSVAIDNGAETVVMVVNRSESGIACVEGTDSLMYWRIGGGVSSLCVNECIGSGVELLAITEDCRMLSLSVGIQNTKSKFSLMSQSTSITPTQAPVLQVRSGVDSQPMKRRKISTIPIGTGKAQHFAAGFDFPSLSGKFITAFLSQKGDRLG